jgi:hypothetical protein
MAQRGAQSRGGIAGIARKFDLDVPSSASQFEKEAGHDNIRDLHNFLYTRIFRWNPS